jgi:hypothetical protein
MGIRALKFDRLISTVQVLKEHALSVIISGPDSDARNDQSDTLESGMKPALTRVGGAMSLGHFSIPAGATLASLLESIPPCQVDEDVLDCISTFPPPIRDESELFELGLMRFDGSQRTQDMHLKLAGLGLRAATPVEMMAYCTSVLKLLKPIVCLGSNWMKFDRIKQIHERHAMVVEERDGKRAADLQWAGPARIWDERYHVPVVRK